MYDISAIEHFDLNSMCKCPHINIIGKRGTGKSQLCKLFLEHYSYVPYKVIISPSESLCPFYSEHFPDAEIYFNYDTNILTKILTRSKDIMEQYPNGNTIIIFDNCLFSKGNDKILKELMLNSKRYGIINVLTMQFPLEITPELRNNFDYVFLYKDNSASNIKRLYDQYGDMFSDFNTFSIMFTQITGNMQEYNSMVIVNRYTHQNFIDKIKWYNTCKNTDSNNSTKLMLGLQSKALL